MNNSTALAKSRAQQQLKSLVEVLKDSSKDLMPAIDRLASVSRMEKTPENLAQIEKDIATVENFYRIAHGVQNANFPEDFYKTPEGSVLADAQVWLYGDDLMSMPDAALILFDLKNDKEYSGKLRVRMSSFVGERPPKLTLFWDEHAPYKKRVSRREVLELKNKIERDGKNRAD